MALTKPPLKTKVRLTIDNSHLASYSVAWCPETYCIEGVVYFSNPWDSKESIRLLCTDHTIKYPVIPMALVTKIEVLGAETGQLPVEVVEVVDDEPPRPPPKPIERIFSIESSKKGSFYKVVKRGDYWRCDCIAGSHGRACKHVKQAQDQLEAS